MASYYTRACLLASLLALALLAGGHSRVAAQGTASQPPITPELKALLEQVDARCGPDVRGAGEPARAGGNVGAGPWTVV